MTIGASLGAETKFFSSHSVWQRVDPELIGVDSLKDKLVNLLDTIVKNGLPEVLREIHDKLEQNTTNGGSLCREDSVFNEKIAKSVEVVSYVPTSEATLKVGDVVEVLNASANTWVTAKIDRAGTGAAAGKWGCNDGKAYSPPEEIRHPRIPDLTELKKEIDSNRGEELTIFLSYQVFKNIVQRNVKKWAISMNGLEEFYGKEVQSLCRNAADALKLPKSLTQLLKTTALKCVAVLRLETVVMLQQEMDMEHFPFTLNHYLTDNMIKLVRFFSILTLIFSVYNFRN
jgi:hypothetical protein